MRRRSSPLPVASSIDQQPSTPTQQRIPTPPIPGRSSPNWTPGMPQRPVSIARQAPPSPTGVYSPGSAIQRTPNPLRRSSFQGTPGVMNDGTRLPGQFTPQRPILPNQASMQRPVVPGQQQWQQQNYQQSPVPQQQQGMMGRPTPQPIQPRIPGQMPGMVQQNSQIQGTQLGLPPQEPPRIPQMPNMVARPGSPGQQRIAPRPPMYPQSGLVPIRPAPPVTSMQSPAPVSAQPGPGPNIRSHNGPIDAQIPNQFRPQRPGQDNQQFQGFPQGQRPQGPQPFMGQPRQAQSHMVPSQDRTPYQGVGGYRGGQPIAIAPKPTSSPR